MKRIILYHGSPKIIENPIFGEGKTYNDYGQGFYCTEYLELAKEWACTNDNKGYANKYELNLDGLKILDLSNEKYTILNWLAILMENRIVNLSTPIQRQARKYLLDNFLPDYKNYDVIIGYRADDAYFSFARAFVSNEISLYQLGLAMKLGKLGLQYCLKSKKAFNQLKFIDYVDADNLIYYSKKKSRDEEARNAYLKELENIDLNGIYMLDIIKDGMKNDDKKLRL